LIAMSTSHPAAPEQPADAPLVTMYTGGMCGYCARVRALLTRKGVRWLEIDVDDPARRAEMIARTGRRSVPQIFIGERHVGGSHELAELDRSGELDALLAGATAPHAQSSQHRT
jgi:glutaredoxin 3